MSPRRVYAKINNQWVVEARGLGYGGHLNLTLSTPFRSR